MPPAIRFRRETFASAVFLIAFCLFPCFAEAAESDPGRPNILLIMADDLGYSDLGCYGGEIATPNLDTLAADGIRFTQFYNTGRCWPTRGSLLTGYYAQQIRRDTLPGVATGSGNRGKRPDWAKLIPDQLAGVGYRCYHTGKWHIDGDPLEQGFDATSFVKTAGQFFQMPPGKERRVSTKEFYVTTLMADQAIKELQSHQRDHDDRPFFHYLAFTAPHFPLHALAEDIAVYKGKYDVGWDVIRTQRLRRMRELGLLDPTSVPRASTVERDLGPPYHFPDAFEILGPGEVNRPLPWNQLTEQQQAFQSMKMELHAAMIHRMDLEIGRVFDQIKTMGRWENTLVMFLSDNGASAEIMVRGDGHDRNADPGSAYSYLCLGPGWSTTCNTPFRRHKTWTHEGGTATPFLASWPAGIDSHGEIRRNPRHVIDVSATLLELTGARRADDAPQSPGISFVADLKKEVPAEVRTIWWFHDGHRAVRKGDWKAVSPLGEPWELYDLSKDRIEQIDLAVPRPEMLRELVELWESQLEATIELATKDLTEKQLAKAGPGRSPMMNRAQQLALPKRKQVLPNGKAFRINDRHAFLMTPKNHAKSGLGKPWVFYGPTLPQYPDKHESWLHEQLLENGIAVAGIDIGEAYGSPHSQPHFDALYDWMVEQGYSTKPALLGRSRGGLWVSRFAIERPDRVSGIAGIYPVYDYTTYPGVKRAAAAYGATADELLAKQDQLNPIRKANSIVQAGIPVFIIHGKEDTVVPIKENSEALVRAYEDAGQSSLITLERVENQGHNFWPGFFHSQAMVDFLIEVTTDK